jgi:hypothetical protein
MRLALLARFIWIIRTGRIDVGRWVCLRGAEPHEWERIKASAMESKYYPFNPLP